MTEQTQPTDALAKLRHLYANMINGGVRDADSAKRIADGLLSPAIAELEKGGTPAGAGEVVDRADAVNLARNALGPYNCAITKKGVRVLAEAVLSMDAALTTPQPTQAQAGAVPLTRYRVLEPRVDRIEADDEYLQDDAQTWATDPNGTFVGTIYGYALRAARRRIKGADHG